MMVYSALVAFFGCLSPFLIQSAHAQKPNIIMIMSDDQDLLMDSLQYQPSVQKHFRESGTFFERHYCTIAQCCPSRVSLLTGKAAHNTNVTDVRQPYGGFSKFVQEGLNGQWLPSWFQQNGYSTYYAGKLMNDHSITNYDKPYPAGFNGTDFLVDPGTYIYYNATMQSNQDPPRNLPGEYSTDVVASRAVDFMTEAAKSQSPFFLTVAPVGPHGETWFPRSPQNPGNFPIFNPPVPATRHKDLYQGARVPRGTNFNPDTIANASSYFKTLPKWNQTVIDYYDEFHRLRLASLAAVDDLVETVVGKVDELDIMENTYIIYTSDNGFHIGQHRLPAGKSCAIEEDINVPFLIRGPNVPKNLTVQYPTSHTDIAPTLFDLAGIPLRDDFDGVPMPIRDCANQVTRQEHVNVEFWGSNIPEGEFGPSLMGIGANNTYKALRLISDDFSFNLLYVVWCTNERKLYDLNVDPGQIDNIAIDFNARAYTDTNYIGERTTRQIGGFYADDVQYRLDSLLLVLKTCKGNTCVQPWKVLHPDGSVNSLKDAMNKVYQCFYRHQPDISFSGCALGYIQELEGPSSADIIAWNPNEQKTDSVQMYGCQDRT